MTIEQRRIDSIPDGTIVVPLQRGGYTVYVYILQAENPGNVSWPHRGVIVLKISAAGIKTDSFGGPEPHRARYTSVERFSTRVLINS